MTAGATPPASLIWLASYPKSGNTWLRAFLANYLEGGEAPLPLAALPRAARGDVEAAAYAALSGGDHRSLTPQAALALRPRHLAALAASGPRVFVKTHHPNATVGGLRLIPPELTRAAIYVSRNPLDVVISFADHYGTDLPTAARMLGNPHGGLRPNDAGVGQYLGPWSGHVASWTGETAFPVLALRYEDIVADPLAAFARVVRAIGEEPDPARLARAVEFSSFGTLSRLEAETGFAERAASQRRFFRKGEAGQWRDALPPDLAAAIREGQGEAMRRLGYL